MVLFALVNNLVTTKRLEVQNILKRRTAQHTWRDRRGRDCMVATLTTTCAIMSPNPIHGEVCSI